MFYYIYDVDTPGGIHYVYFNVLHYIYTGLMYLYL